MSRDLALSRHTTTILLLLVLVSPLVVVLPAAARGAVGPTWDRTYVDEIPGSSSVGQTKDGGFIITALSSGQWVMKANAAGMPEWQGEYIPGGYSVCCDHTIRTVIQTSDGGYAILGSALSKGYVTGFDAWLLKLDRRGSVEWSKTYGGAQDDWFSSGRQTFDGGYIVAGNTQSFGSNDASNGWVLRLDAQGGVLWQEVFAAQDIFSIDETSDGNFLVAGAVGLSGQAVLWVSELGPQGKVTWQIAYPIPPIVSRGPNLIFGAMARQTSSRDIIVMAEVSGYFLISDVTILKLDHLGRIIWDRSYTGGGFTEPSSISETSDGGFILAGRFLQANPSREVGAPLVGLSGPFLLRLDAEGNLVWQKIYGEANDFLSQAQQTRDGGIIAVGSHAGGNLAWALKLDSTGSIRGCPVGVPSNATFTDTRTTTASTTVIGTSTDAAVTSTEVTVTIPIVIIRDQCKIMTKTV